MKKPYCKFDRLFSTSAGDFGFSARSAAGGEGERSGGNPQGGRAVQPGRLQDTVQEGPIQRLLLQDAWVVAALVVVGARVVAALVVVGARVVVDYKYIKI